MQEPVFKLRTCYPSQREKWSCVYANNCRDELGVRWRGRAAPTFSRLKLFFPYDYIEKK